MEKEITELCPNQCHNIARFQIPWLQTIKKGVWPFRYKRFFVCCSWCGVRTRETKNKELAIFLWNNNDYDYE